MTKRHSFLTRSLALLLALVMVLSNANLGLRAFAAEGETITAVELLKKNYDLSDAMLALLESGYLPIEKYAVDTDKSADNLIVEVDTKQDSLTAHSANGKWEAVKYAVTTADGTSEFTGSDAAMELMAKYHDKYDTVEVTFAQYVDVSTDYINGLTFGAPFNLKNDVAHLDEAQNWNGNMMIVAEALDLLQTLADKSAEVEKPMFDDDAVAAIKALKAQKSDNGGELTLAAMNGGYQTADSATKYAIDNGKAFAKEIETLDELLGAIYNGNTVDTGLLLEYQLISESDASLWNTFEGALEELHYALADAASSWNWGAWTVVSLTDKVDYVELDKLVKAIDYKDMIEVKDGALLVDTATVKWVNTQTTKTVAVEVILNGYFEEIGGFSEVTTENVVVNIDATEEEILAAVAEAEAKAVASWGDKYIAEHTTRVEPFYDVMTNEDPFYSVSYDINWYKVTTNYGEDFEYPYGFVLYLPVHEDTNFAYAYTVNGETVEEDSEIVITGDTVITRASGNQFVKSDLYTAVAEAYGNDVVKEILTSGALKGNTKISARQPDASLLSLDGTDLVGKTYASEFKGYTWAPYSYTAGGAKGTFSGTSASVDPAPKTAAVTYRLNLTEYDAKVAEILALAVTLKEDAAGQLSAMERLLAKRVDMDQLDSAKIGVIKPLVSGYEYDIDGASNAELQSYFSKAVSELELCIDKDGVYGTKGELKLFNMLGQYQNEGFSYYYKNAEAIKAEVAELSKCASTLVGDSIKEQALTKLLGALGMESYVQFIADLGRVMGEINEDLTTPNAAIDLTSANLPALLDALLSEGAAEYTTPGAAYIEAAPLTVVNAGLAMIEIKVYVDGKEKGSVSDGLGFGETLTASMIADLKAQAEAIFNNTTLYVKKIEGELKETLMEGNLSMSIYFTAKDFIATIVEDGETVGTQTFNVNNPYVSVAQHADYPLYAYEYYLNGVKMTLGSYKVTDLKDFTIDRITKEQAKQELEDAENKLNQNTSGNDYIFDHETKTFTANIVPTGKGFQDFAMGMLDLGYPHVMVNGKFLMTQDTVEGYEGEAIFSMQAIIDGMMADKGFNTDRMIALRDASETNVKTLFTSDNASFRHEADEEYLEGWNFVLNLKGTNSQLTKVANGLEAIKPYMYFQSAGDYMDIDLNLPQPVYEIYLTAILATNYNRFDKTNINEINNEIAYRFLYDYVEDILDTDATAASFQNTIDMLIKEAEELTDKDLPSINVEQYGPYYDLVKKLIVDNQIDISFDEDNANVTVTAKDDNVPTVLGFLMEQVGEDYAIFLRMVDEYKHSGTVTASAKVNLENVDIDYEAVLIDAGARNASSKTAALKTVYDFTDNLAKRAQTLGESVIVLLDDVNSNLSFSDVTVIDLNGYTINGNVSGSGKVIIVDTNPYTAGSVTGTISGNVSILDGVYSQDVTKFLKDGYIQTETGRVQNAVYRLEGGNIVLNTNFLFDENIDGYLPAVKYMAVDLAMDLILNCYTCASLNIDGNDIYSVSFDDLVAILGSPANSDKVAALIDDLLESIHFDPVNGTGGIDDFINAVAEDLLDLDAIAAAIRSGEKIGDYTFTTNAWSVAVGYEPNGDYVYAGIIPDKSVTKDVTFALTLDTSDNGAKTDKILAYVDEMAKILVSKGDAESDGTNYSRLIVDVAQPVRDGKNLNVKGSAEAFLSLDFSHREEYYVPMLSIALSYADPEAFEGLVEEMKEILDRYNINDPHVFDEITYLDQCAINDALAAALEAAIDQVTAREIFETLTTLGEKAYDKADARYDFVTIAEKAGIKLAERFSDDRLKKLDEAYEYFLRLVNKVLAKIDASTIIDNPMSALKTEDGAYMIEGDIKDKAPKNVDYRGYGVTADLDTCYAGIKIKLFAEDCLWGDANHDGYVNAKDATLVLQYSVGADINGYFCTKRTNVDAQYDVNAKDATLILQHSVGTINKFPAEN